MGRNHDLLKGNYYITGASGTGKSAVARLLRSLDVEAIDLDRLPGLSYWRDAEGNRVKSPPAHTIDQHFIMKHKYQFDAEIIGQLLEANKDKLIFYCGSASNQRTYLRKFDMAFVLHCDGKEIRRRLAKRPDAFGKNPSLSRWLGTSNLEYVKRLKRVGAIVVDSRRSIEDVVTEILFLILGAATGRIKARRKGAAAVATQTLEMLENEVAEILLRLRLRYDRKFCYVLEPGPGRTDWQDQLRAAGNLVIDTRRAEPDITADGAKIMASSDFKNFIRRSRSDRSSMADAMKILKLVMHGGPGPVIFVDDSRNLDRFRPYLSDLYLMMERAAPPGLRALYDRAILDGAYAIDSALPAAVIAQKIAAVANRPGPGHLRIPDSDFAA